MLCWQNIALEFRFEVTGLNGLRSTKPKPVFESRPRFANATQQLYGSVPATKGCDRVNLGIEISQSGA